MHQRVGVQQQDEVPARLRHRLIVRGGKAAVLVIADQLDLAYLELRMGCWGFAPSYASVTPLRLHPLISRRSFVAMLSLPPDWRRMQDRSNRMIQAVVRQGWPELLDLPISRYGDYRDRTGLVLRALRQPHLVTKKLRKMFG